MPSVYKALHTATVAVFSAYKVMYIVRHSYTEPPHVDKAIL